MQSDQDTQQSKKHLQIVRSFNVSPEIAFDAFTKPEAMRAWWTDTTTFDIDLRTGGQWKIDRIEGSETYTAKGEYLEVKQPTHLRYTYQMPQFSPNTDVITIDITPNEEGGCAVTFAQDGPDINAELQELPDGSISQSEMGWQQGFDLMEESWKKQGLSK